MAATTLSDGGSVGLPELLRSGGFKDAALAGLGQHNLKLKSRELRDEVY